MASKNYFNNDALQAYTQWIKTTHGVVTTIIDVPELPIVCSMLAGAADAMIKNRNNEVWPVLVKKVYQSQYSDIKTVAEIAESRGDNFYLVKDNDGKWRVKKNTQVYFACQNILMCHDYESMDLIVYNERNNDLLVVSVTVDPRTFKANVAALKNFLDGK